MTLGRKGIGVKFDINILWFGLNFLLSLLYQGLTFTLDLVLSLLCQGLTLLRKDATTFSAIGSCTAAIVALYLGAGREFFRRPKLAISFNAQKDPFVHKLPFEEIHSIELDELMKFFTPGFNSRVKVLNRGKTTARKVQARVEKIVLKDLKGGQPETKYYHPTVIKWSGEKDWNPVDIVPHSHFFLDLFWSKNETSEEILNFFNDLYRDHEVKEEILRDIIQSDIKPAERIFWNVWIDTSYPRGVAKFYEFEGEVIISIIINAENCKSSRFEAIIDWSKQRWANPEIQIRRNGKIIGE